jgi:hypothetical protein
MGPEAPAGALPSLAEAQAWVGSGLDDAGGNHVGRVEGLYADAEAGTPAWLVVALGGGGARRFALRRRRAKSVALPIRECAAMPGRVWTAQPAPALRDAPPIDPSRPLLREHELAICAHYGIGETAGRHAEVSGRAQGTITAHPTTAN